MWSSLGGVSGGVQGTGPDAATHGCVVASDDPADVGETVVETEAVQ